MNTSVYEFAVMVSPVKNRGSYEMFKEFKELKGFPKRQKPPVVCIEGTMTVRDLMVMMYNTWLGAWNETRSTRYLGHHLREELDEHLWNIVLRPPHYHRHGTINRYKVPHRGEEYNLPEPSLRLTMYQPTYPGTGGVENDPQRHQYKIKNINTTVDEMGLLEEEDGHILDILWDFGAGWSFEVELVSVTVGDA